MYYDTLLLHEAIRQLLISIRQKRRHTQHSLSLESGISRQYISQMECGKKTPSIDTLFQLSIALKTNISSLMIELDRFYQRLFWQQNTKHVNRFKHSLQNVADSEELAREYIRKARGKRTP
ncbi:helix-turn-helix transcriptional regulator [Fibrobacter sp. UBA4297]|uniref:helix-turn-helix domain-containing protein n=1 Tax=Fibrobacter sp. UBA4297 TaxID=1946536 RepID=UPI0025C244F6|nr:helix-turn-helix transcriptional regulator [Fibrobacter sp. UBA4297]